MVIVIYFVDAWVDLKITGNKTEEDVPPVHLQNIELESALLYTEKQLDIKNCTFSGVRMYVNISKHSVTTKAIEIFRTRFMVHNMFSSIFVLRGVNNIQMAECYVYNNVFVTTKHFQDFTILKLQINNTTFSGALLYLDAFDKDTVISLNITDSNFYWTHIEQAVSFGNF